MPHSISVLATFLAAVVALPALAQDSPADSARKAKQLFVEGLTKTQVDDHEAALKLYEEALEHAPGQPDILGAAAEAYHATGDPDAAILYARQAARQASDQPVYGRRLAALLATQDRPQEALKAYRSVLDRFPEDRPTLRALAQFHAEQDQAGDALRTYAQLLQAGADSAAVLEEMAPLYQQHPDVAALNSALRDALDNRQRTREGQSATDAPREAGGAASLVARARDEEENPEQAHRLLRRALEQDANHPEALALLGNLLFQEEDYEEAASYLTQFVQQNPRDATLWRRTAEALRRSDQPAEARRIADEGLLLFPGHLPLLRVSARAALDSDDPAAALNRASKALNLLDEESNASPKQRAAFLLIKGDVLAAQDRMQSARRAWEQARELDPSNAEVQDRLREQ